MKHILVAEDDLSIRQFMTTALKRAGHQVTACADGLTAYQHVQQAQENPHLPPVDLLLTDIVMPGMDGIELSARARQLRPLMPVLFITGMGMVAPSQLQAAGQTRAQVLTKPLHLRSLLNQINQILGASEPSPSAPAE